MKCRERKKKNIVIEERRENGKMQLILALSISKCRNTVLQGVSINRPIGKVVFFIECHFPDQTNHQQTWIRRKTTKTPYHKRYNKNTTPEEEENNTRNKILQTRKWR